MLRKALLFFIILASAAAAGAEEYPDGAEILRLIDENLVLDRATGISVMVIHARSGTRTIKSRFHVRGQNESYVEYLSPARERGKKMLKLEDKLWTYAPEPADRIITISGHLLRQSVMGSDLSYEDMMENNRLDELYDAVVTGTDAIDGRDTWVIEMTAKEGEDVAYHSRKVWVDRERYLPLREERFAKSGRLLKTTEIREALQQDGRWYMKRAVFKDMLSSGEGTEYIIEEIDFEAEIPDHLFTRASLRK
jgi:outer membrane lipoprotein-sorting protein